MVIYFNLDTDGFLTGWSSTRSNNDDKRLYVNDNHEVLTNPFIFKYIDDALIKDEERQKEMQDEQEKEDNKLTETERLEEALLDLAELSMLGGE